MKLPLKVTYSAFQDSEIAKGVEYRVRDGRLVEAIVDADGVEVFQNNCGCCGYVFYPDDTEDFVSSINAHDDLVAALLDIVAVSHGYVASDAAKQIGTIARAALKKAGAL